MTEISNNVRRLADLVAKGYKSISLVSSENRIIKPIIAESITSKRNSFLQIGSRQKIPMWVFTGNADASPIAHEFADFLRRSEIKLLLDTIENIQKKKDIGSLSEIAYNKLESLILSLDFNPSDMFVPLSAFTQFFKFYGKITFERANDWYYLKVGENQIRVHRSNKFLPFDKIYLIDTEGVTWLQKKVRDMRISRAKDPPYVELLTQDEDVLQISSGLGKGTYVDFIMRLVVYVSIDKNKVKLIKPPSNSSKD